MQEVAAMTLIPVGALSDFERGIRSLNDADLRALSQMYDYENPRALAKAVLPAKSAVR